MCLETADGYFVGQHLALQAQAVYEIDDIVVFQAQYYYTEHFVNIVVVNVPLKDIGLCIEQVRYTEFSVG